MTNTSRSDTAPGPAVAMPPSEPRAVHVVVSLELRLEREAICSAMAIMRPHWTVRAVSPDELEAELRTTDVDVVVCSTGIPLPRHLPRVVISIHPFGDNRCIVAVDGRISEISQPSFIAVLSVIDRVYE